MFLKIEVPSGTVVAISPGPAPAAAIRKISQSLLLKFMVGGQKVHASSYPFFCATPHAVFGLRVSTP